MLEEGEIESIAGSSLYGPVDLPQVDTTGRTYSPAIEWPGDTESTPEPLLYDDTTVYEPTSNTPAPSGSLRLLVQQTAILRKNQRIALLDGYSQTEIGRDVAAAGSDIPRIRLKEMEVSKLHATIYWDQDRTQWSIVDMGSKHGTFIQSSAAPPPSTSSALGLDERGSRLSAPRIASMPRALHHMDRLTIGGTTFAVHVHEGRAPCTACSPQGDEEIPLFLHRAGSTAGATAMSSSSNKRKLDEVSSASSWDPTAARSRDPRKALSMLKRTLLSSKNPAPAPPGSSSRSQYVDRSARRRALHPDMQSAATTPGSASADRSTLSTVPSPSVSAPTTTTPPPPVPLSATNIGHRLLLKQGWQPGTALGEGSGDSGGLVAPLDPPSTVGRAGIGVPARLGSGLPTVVHGGDWRDAGKRRRWEETGGGPDGVQ
uniref:Hormone-sensitive lipase n=1 Tax=Ganoderma boninense TaxID=34458 RepID=A0A5K1K480_9APHY|nr:Hormone-sensitive lipase [Ganoderma boninense]